MNYKLIIGIPVAMVAVFILLESPEYWWLLLAIPVFFIKKQMRSIQNSAGSSMYDEEYQRIFESPPADDNPVTTMLDTDEIKKE